MLRLIRVDRLVAGVALVALTALAGRAGAAMTAPDVLVKNVTLEVIGIIKHDQAMRNGDRKKLIGLIESKVLPHFDMRSMTASAVGPGWRKATPEQRAQLTEQFKTLLVRTYASALTDFSNQKFDFLPLHMSPGDTDVMVRVRVLQPDAQPVPIDYSMERTAEGWKVYDVSVGLISLVSNYRTEFGNLVRSQGVEGLIRALKAKNATLEHSGGRDGK